MGHSILQRNATPPLAHKPLRPHTLMHSAHTERAADEMRDNRDIGDARIVLDGSFASGPSSPLEEQLPSGSIHNRSNSIPRAPATCGPGLKDGKGILPLSVRRALGKVSVDHRILAIYRTPERTKPLTPLKLSDSCDSPTTFDIDPIRKDRL